MSFFSKFVCAYFKSVVCACKKTDSKGFCVLKKLNVLLNSKITTITIVATAAVMTTT